MAISLNDGNARASYPVIRHQKIGEVANLAIVRFEQRERLRKNLNSGALEPIPNGTDRKGQPKFKQEMVIHAIAMPGTTMEARIGDEGGVPAPGDRVRLILKAKGFGDWIEARRGHRRGQLDVGDVLVMETRWAQQYDQAGTPKGTKIEDQAAAASVPRNVTIGFYGPLTLKPGTDPQWIAAAEEAYRADQSAARQPIPLAPDAGDYGEEEV